MTDEAAIRVEGLSKCYKLGITHAGSIRDLVDSSMGRLLGRQRRPHSQVSAHQQGAGAGSVRGDENGYIWALRDASFQVQRGEVLGVIGGNGAGKSTLLKILARVTAPTAGRAEIDGRVGSLLEVGTGFHPELSGRENVFLNGAILGMSRAEIRRKFDEIVAFADIEQFIDTPVKRYSSGMYVRLAFAVAAHLDPDILLVDEVLAVGDAAFQKKCLGKMSDVASHARTVLFVSHNMSAVAQLCGRCIWLEGGEIKAILPAAEAVKSYLETGSSDVPSATFPADLSKPAQYHSVAVCRTDGSVVSEISADEEFVIRLVFEVRRFIPGLYLVFFLTNTEGIRVLFSDITDSHPEIGDRLTTGVHTFHVPIPARLLAPAKYSITVSSATTYRWETIDRRPNACSFTIRDYSTRRGDSRPGVIGTKLIWNRSFREAPFEPMSTADCASETTDASGAI